MNGRYKMLEHLMKSASLPKVAPAQLTICVHKYQFASASMTRTPEVLSSPSILSDCVKSALHKTVSESILSFFRTRLAR